MEGVDVVSRSGVAVIAWEAGPCDWDLTPENARCGNGCSEMKGGESIFKCGSEEQNEILEQEIRILWVVPWH